MVVIKVYLQRDDSLSALTLAISCCFWFYSRLVVVVFLLLFVSSCYSFFKL